MPRPSNERLMDATGAGPGRGGWWSLAGRTALVAGASRGIGLAIARGLADAGARTILGARSRGALEAAVADLRADGLDADMLVLDTTDHASVESAVAGLPDVDVLVNVVGTNIRKPFLEYSQAEIDGLLATNLMGLIDLTRAVGRRMVEARRGGKVLFIGSLVIHVGVPYVSIYAATKGALAALTKALAAEWAPAGIQVNCIAPGMILTDLNRRMWESEALRAWLASVQANPRLGSPEDLAPLAVLLAGAGSDYITGQTIAVDGGYTTTKMWPFQGDASPTGGD
jgi:gluconate 5-dehydrogenase